MTTAPTPLPVLVGMVHLPPLPGSPRFAGSMPAGVEEPVERATLLVDHGFEAVMVENFGDEPFFADAVPPVTVAGITACVSAIRQAVPARVGVNVLRTDALSAVAVAAATGAEFIRVNVLSGIHEHRPGTDRGPGG